MVLVWIIILLAICAIFGTAAIASISAAPWLPVRKKDYPRILKMLKGKQGACYELGAGDARLCMAIANETPLTCIGFEISLIPFLAGKIRLASNRSKQRPQLVFKNFFHADFSKASVIFCFLTPPAMKKLREKFMRECKPGTRIISYSFSLPDWQPQNVNRDGTGIPIYVYDK